MAFLKDSTQLLKNRQFKITTPRLAVLEVLSKAEKPLSAYDIGNRISKKTHSSVVTIYRVLEVFEELGIVHRIHTREGYVRCDFEMKQGCHYFAVCDQCGRTSEFLGKEPCPIQKMIPKNFPFKNLKHLTEISGTCDHCS